MELAKVWAKLLDPNIMSKFNNDISQQALHDLQVSVIRNIWYLVMSQPIQEIIPTIIEASSLDHLFQFLNDPDNICCSLYLKIAIYHPELVDRRKIVPQATQLIERGENEDDIGLFFDVLLVFINFYNELSSETLKDLADFSVRAIYSHGTDDNPIAFEYLCKYVNNYERALLVLEHIKEKKKTDIFSIEITSRLFIPLFKRMVFNIGKKILNYLDIEKIFRDVLLDEELELVIDDVKEIFDFLVEKNMIDEQVKTEFRELLDDFYKHDMED